MGFMCGNTKTSVYYWQITCGRRDGLAADNKCNVKKKKNCYSNCHNKKCVCVCVHTHTHTHTYIYNINLSESDCPSLSDG